MAAAPADHTAMVDPAADRPAADLTDHANRNLLAGQRYTALNSAAKSLQSRYSMTPVSGHVNRMGIPAQS